MKAYIITILIVFYIDIIGKAISLKQSNFIRKPHHVMLDMVVNLALLVWAAVLLGGAD